MTNYNVLSELIASHTDKARTRAERIMRAASVKAHAMAAEQAEPQRLTRAEVEQLRAEAKAQADQLSQDLRAQAARMVTDLGGKA
ncbi:hypothetical protein GPX89_25485 [Nocardia sp. ET3-3]|uniref:Uncharacterized protein n=1 Tax=Nocardia terrae TaxID=2675851 RepID=A0A7K1V1R8_9NOCA|nr:hypothetical protein [Nocardia terrae]MVU80590.1 hypothetical protein [Nocardia terrae]